MKPAYYNEFEPYAAAWLRNLIAAGLIPAGDVDERSITDVRPDDLRGYAQCHFFAGIGGWALAARLAGWPDDRELWTGSPPCQPFSVAGKGKAQADDRHLWPDFFRIIRARRPAVVMGEQVAAAVGTGGGRSDARHVSDAKVIPEREPDYKNPAIAAGRSSRPVSLERSHWDGAGWVIGHDGKARRVEPSIRLLAHGVPARVGRLRAYGNAIVPPVAVEVIGAYLDCRP